MTALPDNLPINDVERDHAVERLQEAFTEGHISRKEMDDRLHQVLTAKTRSDLAPPLASLPEPDQGAVPTIAAVSGRLVRRGPWRVPRSFQVASAFGRVHLDLSEAVIEHPVIDIELGLGTGSAKITVPRDAVVDIDGLQGGWKDVRYTPPRRSSVGNPTIRITGTTGFGRLKIRHARR
ncbi:DUF1707 domain-containing protein [Kitasatospora sp. MY 5-36]|uniref:DUF1707 SHOCT-like domain-containing protein n=1 Tax=Kitasatospora sp. MY 5-36 TaxID=1678027 RepID=UPI000671324A|nr:DUF1707 domain-containing protein [Kitasatospora sp. MY 5-36]